MTPTEFTHAPKRSRRFRLATAAAAIAGALMLSACSAATTEPEQPQASETPAAPVAVEIPDTPVGKAVQHVVDVLNAEAETTASDWEGFFDESFTEQVPLDELTALLNVQFLPAQPFTVIAYEGTEDEAVATLHTDLADPFDVTVVVGGDGLVTGLLFTPAETDDWVAPTSLSELTERISELPATVRALIISADALRGGGEALLDIDSADAAPTASVFKLYVLYAVAQAIEAGTLTWSEQLEITDDVRSLPSGELQNEPAGTLVTVREAAEKMIAISDNTATDMLIKRLGREQVEAAVAAAGHQNPAAMTPFLTTRELFLLGWSDDALLASWSAAGADERRELLAGFATRDLNVDAILEAIAGPPVWPAGAEWFAAPSDIARVHLALTDTANPELAAEIDAILSANPGVATTGWQYVGFKGGSSPGVVTGSWRVSDAAGNTYVVVMQASTEDAAGIGAHQMEFFRLAQAALNLTAEQVD